jgi:integrase
VTRTIANWGEERGIENLTPRKLRASLGLTLARLKVDPGLIAKLLRHKDPATALRHYISYNLEEARQFLEKAEIGCDDPLSQEGLQEYSRMLTLVGRNQ